MSDIEFYFTNFNELHVIKGEVSFRIKDKPFVEQYSINLITKEFSITDYDIPDSWKKSFNVIDELKNYIETQVIEYVDTHKH